MTTSDEVKNRQMEELYAFARQQEELRQKKKDKVRANHYRHSDTYLETKKHLAELKELGAKKDE